MTRPRTRAAEANREARTRTHFATRHPHVPQAWDHPLCGRISNGRQATTTDPAKVTCRRCLARLRAQKTNPAPRVTALLFWSGALGRFATIPED